jgi:DNA-binding SARP family transcriptional activator/Tfp pilus assembly protein PilF
MQFRLLGPVEIHSGGQVIEIGPPQQRLLTAALAVDAGRLVTAESLIDRVWDDAPAGARRTLHVLISKMRRMLKHARQPDQEGVTVARRSGGYVLELGPDRVDLLRFRRLAVDARQADDASRVTSLRDAVALWQGEPLSGLPGNWAARTRQAWRQEYLEVAVGWARAELLSGDPAATIGTLTMLAEENPLAESVPAALMLALRAVGRPADALACYAQARRRLAEELGVDPGAELQAIYQATLRDASRAPDAPAAVTVSPAAADPAPAVSERAPAAVGHARRVAPRELPAPVAHFAGRAAEFAALTGLLDQREEQMPGAVVISAIGGTAGVGKTALAVHWAHQVAERFPDGQLYVNLRGYDPGQPVPAADVLAGFLRSLGVPGQDIPPDQDQRAARYRSLLAGQRVLIVLDNAGSADQVRPLLPGSPACTVVVTSRGALAGLVARDGAARLDLDVLSPAEAVALLRALIGTRVDAEPAAAAELAGQCCRLPLALRVAAELAAARPAASLAALVSELADLQTRLDLLEAGGDPGTGVRAVFSWSRRHLHPEAARTFRLLGLHPGPDFEPYAAAALTGTTLSQARQALDALARAYLISPAAPGRYGMHDLLRAYARDLAAGTGTGDERHAALTRLFDHYLHTAAAAMDILVPAERHRRPRISGPATPIPPLADPAAPRDWLDAERATLVAATGHAAGSHWPGHATRLSATVFRYLYTSGHLPEARTVSSHALGTARRTGDGAAEAAALNQIGAVDGQQGRLQQAADHHQQALVLFRAVGDRAGEAITLSNLGIAETALDRYEQAARHQQEALAIFRDIGDRFGETRTLGNLGWARRRQGRNQEAAGYYRQTLALSREIGDREGEGNTLGRLGVIDLRLGRYDHAAEYFRQALVLLRETGDTSGQTEGLLSLGEACLGLGRYQQAAGNFEQALAMSREIGDPGLEANARNGLGDAAFQAGDAGQARRHHATALRIASEANVPEHQARAHSGLARGCQADGDWVQARHHWREALSRYAAIGAPEATEIRARLATTTDSDDDGLVDQHR